MITYMNKTAAMAGTLALVAMLGVPGTAAADDASCGTCTMPASAKAGPTIPEVAAGAGQFGTLLAAVEAAGLAGTLSGDGPFTVFAPTDEAFAKLPEGTVESLLANPDKLKGILLHHVVMGKVKAAEVVEAAALTTAYGQPVAVKTADDSVSVGGAAVVMADVKASNGVIHVIDTVMLPQDLIGVAASTSDFSTLVKAVQTAGLVDVLKGEGPYTIFAPTNKAFANLPAGTVENLLKPENRAQLQAILKYHVVPGNLKAEDVLKLERARTAHGDTIHIKKSEKEGVRINEAKLVQTDIVATNGVIHVIDAVILPAS